MHQISIRYIVLGLALAVIADAHSDGAPPNVCDTMIPGHGVDPQTSDPPYQVTTHILQGGRLDITIKPNSSDHTFKGFFLQVRDFFNKKPFGEFLLAPESRFVDCPPGHNNSLTHISDTEKKEFTARWIVPQDFRGEAYAIATVLRDITEFWVGIRARSIYVSSGL